MNRPIQEKESYKWIKGLHQRRRDIPAGVQLSEQESDLYDDLIEPPADNVYYQAVKIGPPRKQPGLPPDLTPVTLSAVFCSGKRSHLTALQGWNGFVAPPRSPHL